MRKEYKMTQVQLDRIMDACKPVACMKIGGYAPRSPQQNANMAWNLLGQEMGFNSMTVQPIPGKGPKFFTAEEVINESDRD